MGDTIWQQGVWESYKSIAKAHGLTIPALKRHLQDAGWLAGTRPSEDAVRARVAVVEQMTGGRFGDGERILWNVPTVFEYLAGRGVAPLDGDRARFHIAHRHQAVDRVREAALEVGKLLGFELHGARAASIPTWLVLEHGDDAEGVHDQLESDLRWFEFESHTLVASATRPGEFGQLAESALRALFEAAAIKPDLDRERFEHWRAVAANAIEWVVSRRLAS